MARTNWCCVIYPCWTRFTAVSLILTTFITAVALSSYVGNLPPCMGSTASSACSTHGLVPRNVLSCCKDCYTGADPVDITGRASACDSQCTDLDKSLSFEWQWQCEPPGNPPSLVYRSSFVMVVTLLMAALSVCVVVVIRAVEKHCYRMTHHFTQLPEAPAPYDEL